MKKSTHQSKPKDQASRPDAKMDISALIKQAKLTLAEPPTPPHQDPNDISAMIAEAESYLGSRPEMPPMQQINEVPTADPFLVPPTVQQSLPMSNNAYLRYFLENLRNSNFQTNSLIYTEEPQTNDSFDPFSEIQGRQPATKRQKPTLNTAIKELTESCHDKDTLMQRLVADVPNIELVSRAPVTEDPFESIPSQDQQSITENPPEYLSFHQDGLHVFKLDKGDYIYDRSHSTSEIANKSAKTIKNALAHIIWKAGIYITSFFEVKKIQLNGETKQIVTFSVNNYKEAQQDYKLIAQKSFTRWFPEVNISNNNTQTNNQTINNFNNPSTFFESPQLGPELVDQLYDIDQEGFESLVSTIEKHSKGCG